MITPGKVHPVTSITEVTREDVVLAELVREAEAAAAVAEQQLCERTKP